jgi:hypothetical protein
MVAAHNAQRTRIAPDPTDIWAGCAQGFRADPHRPLDPLLTAISSYVEATDVLVDVGGGAGRLSLPMASRCREVVVVDPSPAMGAEFAKTLDESRIENARFVAGDWLEAKNVEGDMALVAHVTYFVEDISAFIQKLNRDIRRRVVVNVRSVPPPNQIAPFFRLAHGEDLAPVPGHQELMAVLEALGIRAELVDIGPAQTPSTIGTIGKTREDAVRIELDGGIRVGWLREEDRERVGRLLEDNFDSLLVETPDGFRRRNAVDAREFFITWETR